MKAHREGLTARVNARQSRMFGLMVAACLLMAGAYPLIDGLQVHIWFLWAALGVFLCAIALPGLLRPFATMWLAFGDRLHKVTNPLILGFIYSTTFVPIGFMWRLIGKDPLRLRREPDATTYWLDRVPPGPSADSQKRQF